MTETGAIVQVGVEAHGTISYLPGLVVCGGPDRVNVLVFPDGTNSHDAKHPQNHEGAKLFTADQMDNCQPVWLTSLPKGTGAGEWQPIPKELSKDTEEKTDTAA